MAENKKYGRLIGAQIEYAPRTFFENGNLVVPKVDDDDAYFSRGWLKVVSEKPSCDYSKQTMSFKCWTVDEENKTIAAEYELKDIQDNIVQASKYSKLRLTLFCMKQNLWEQAKELLEKSGYYDLFVMAQYFLDTDEYFQKGIELFKSNYIENGGDQETLDNLVKEMLNFAFDGYETQVVEKKEEQTTEEQTSIENADKAAAES